MNKIQKKATTIAAAFVVVAGLYKAGGLVMHNTQLRSDVDQCAEDLNADVVKHGRLPESPIVCNNDNGTKVADIEIALASYVVQDRRFCLDLNANFDREASRVLKFERVTTCQKVPEERRETGHHNLPINNL